MSNQTPNIAYPSGISPALASNLSTAAQGADTLSGKLDNGNATLSTVTSDVSVIMNQIYTHQKGKSITAMAGFWDGAGAIGSGGLGSGGVISDASKAMNFMTSLSGCMPGISGNINDQIATIKGGLSAIKTVQDNPHKKWTPEEASSLQSQINNLVNALEAINTAFLSTASSIESAASGVKLSANATCASGISIGEDVAPWTPEITPGDRQWLRDHNIEPDRDGGPPDGGDDGGDDDGGGGGGGGDDWHMPRYGWAFLFGTLNTASYAVKDIEHGKDPLTDSKFWELYAVNLALAGAVSPLFAKPGTLLTRLGIEDTPAGQMLARAGIGVWLGATSSAIPPRLVDEFRRLWKTAFGKGSPKGAPTPKPAAS